MECFLVTLSIKPLHRSTEILLEHHSILENIGYQDHDQFSNFKTQVSFESLNTFYFIIVTLA